MSCSPDLCVRTRRSSHRRSSVVRYDEVSGDDDHLLDLVTVTPLPGTGLHRVEVLGAAVRARALVVS